VPSDAVPPAYCRRSGAISRKLGLLGDQGLIQKIGKSYRYKVTIKGPLI
jgi:hypothetical protein